MKLKIERAHHSRLRNSEFPAGTTEHSELAGNTTRRLCTNDIGLCTSNFEWIFVISPRISLITTCNEFLCMRPLRLVARFFRYVVVSFPRFNRDISSRNFVVSSCRRPYSEHSDSDMAIISFMLQV